eukprot:2613663-Alexandrium_andersonii.AAC.1
MAATSKRTGFHIIRRGCGSSRLAGLRGLAQSSTSEPADVGALEVSALGTRVAGVPALGTVAPCAPSCN